MILYRLVNATEVKGLRRGSRYTVALGYNGQEGHNSLAHVSLEKTTRRAVSLMNRRYNGEALLVVKFKADEGTVLEDDPLAKQGKLCGNTWKVSRTPINGTIIGISSIKLHSRGAAFIERGQLKFFLNEYTPDESQGPLEAAFALERYRASTCRIICRDSYYSALEALM